MKVRSHYIPATQGVTERTRKERPELRTFDKTGKEIYLPEKVVPNKALSVKEIFSRYLRGLPIEDGNTSKPVWNKQDADHDSPDMEKLSRMDRMEKKDMARSAKFKIPKKEEPQVPPSGKIPESVA